MEQKTFIEGRDVRGLHSATPWTLAKKIAKAAVSGLQTYKFCGLCRS